MAKSTTSNYKLEIEDSYEKVSNEYLNSNFIKIDTEIKNSRAKNTLKAMADTDKIPIWLGSENVETSRPQYTTGTQLYTWLKNKFDTLYDKSTSTITGAASSIISNNLTANRAVITDANGKITNSTITANEIASLANIGTNVKSQLNAKLDKANSVFDNTLKSSDDGFVYENGELGISTTSSGKPTISLIRGTKTDGQRDWSIVNDGGTLRFINSLNGSDTTTNYIDTDNKMYLGGSRVVTQSLVNDNLASTSSINPLSANQGRILNEKKADTTYVDTELGKKSDKTYVDTELGKKADKTYVDTELGKKADLTYVDTELDKKVNVSDFSDELGELIIDGLTSPSTMHALSANQGRILNDKINGKAQTNHASSASSYGLGDTTTYGHVKTIDNLTNNKRNNTEYYAGEALSASQGKVLDDKITALENTKESIANVDTKVATRAPTNHATSATTYGRGTNTMYGHVKIINDLTNGGRNDSTYAYAGEALAANQGKVLDDKIALKADKTYVDNKVKTDVPLNAKFTDTTYTEATTVAAGLMSSSDKIKLNGVEASADKTPSDLSYFKVVRSGGSAWSESTNRALKFWMDDFHQRTLELKENKADLTYVDAELDKKVNTTDFATRFSELIIDDLMTASTTEALSANQGRILSDNVDSKAPINHASTGGTYGYGTETNYGHVKLINNLTNNERNNTEYYAGEALSASQGKVLDDKINTLGSANNPINSTDPNLIGPRLYFGNINNEGRVQIYASADGDGNHYIAFAFYNPETGRYYSDYLPLTEL